ncbi:MAG: ABC transporter permease [Methanomassiliicoccales archaeon]
MSSLGNMIKKEVKELLTPATLVPIIIMAIVFASLGGVIGGAQKSLVEKPVIGVVDQSQSVLSGVAFNALNSTSKIVYSYNGTDPVKIQEGLSKVQSEGGAALLIFPSNFSQRIMANQSAVVQVYWMMKGAGVLEGVSSAVAGLSISQMNHNVSMYLIDNKVQVSSSVILAPTALSETTVFKDRVMNGISPGQITSIMSGQGIIVPLIIVMVVIMAGGMVITSMGTEKENKTLETLLTLPVSRTSIVVGKLAGAAIVGLIMAVIYMIGMGYYMNSLTASAAVDLGKYGIGLNLFDYVLVGISLFLALISALTLCMLLGIFTKNYKAAQSMTMPITFLALIPMFVLIFSDFDTLPLVGQVLVFAIPFSHPMIAMRSLMFGNSDIVIAGIIYEAIFAAVTMFIAVSLFKKDIVLTGMPKRPGKKSGWSSLIHYPGKK